MVYASQSLIKSVSDGLCWRYFAQTDKEGADKTKSEELSKLQVTVSIQYHHFCMSHKRFCQALWYSYF